MDPHLLRTFVKVASHGSFSQAARELGYTQSAVSQHIAALESDLGTTILRRRPVAPTSAGLRLLEHAGPLLLRLDAARADIARLIAAPADRIVVGISPLAMTALVASALADVRQTQPRLDVTVRVLGREAIITGVATATVDLGLLDGMAAPNDPLNLPDVGPLANGVVAERALIVAIPSAHPLAGRDSVRLADLADARWIDAPDTAISLPQLRAATGSDGYRASLRYEGTDVRGLIALAAAGHGLALLPEIEDLPAGIVAIPMSTPRLVHRTELLHSNALDGPPALLATALTTVTG